MAAAKQKAFTLATRVLHNGAPPIYFHAPPNRMHTPDRKQNIMKYHLTLTYRRFRFTNLVYTLILVHAGILMVGGHWTYAEVR